MKPLFRVVGGLDLEANARKVTAKESQARRRAWLAAVQAKVTAAQLSPIDYLVAKALENFPSANEGYCWAGQSRLAKTVGRKRRTVQASMKRLGTAGLLACKRGGQGKTARWIFCIDGMPILGAGSLKDLRISALDPQKVAHLDPQKVAHKPSQPNPIQQEPPPNPPPTADDAPPLGIQVETAETPEDIELALDGEVLGPENELDFDEWWRSLSRTNPGNLGPALTQWRKLKRQDRQAIAGFVERWGSDLDGMWACVWLRERRWEQEPLRRRYTAASASDLPPRRVKVYRNTPDWDKLVAWRRARKENVDFMLMQSYWPAPSDWKNG